MRLPRRPTLALVAAALATHLCTALGVPPASARERDPVPIGAWPLQPAPEVVTGFDPPAVPWGAGHRGVDLLGTPGQAVHAALQGSVTFAGMLAGRGVVVVSHGDTRTTYEPVAASVGVGTLVAEGAVIGTLAHAGSHCPPSACLHWGWLRGTTYLDPLGLVETGTVRLLPLWREEPVDVVVPLSSWPLPVVAWLGPYATLVTQLAALARPEGTAQARG